MFKPDLNRGPDRADCVTFSLKFGLYLIQRVYSCQKETLLALQI